MKREPTYEACIDFLLGLEKSGIKLGLERTQNLLSAIGSPQNSFKSIHIAGTNGKGSVASMIHSILFSSGYRTGLFTSPHLVCFRERIRSNGECIAKEELVEVVNGIRDHIVNCKASFFEACTAVAFDYFRRKSVDVAVIEVGMGGRLDSTNVITPMVSCICSIDYDHTEYLGKSLAKIAYEKAGIIKPGVPVVCGRMKPTAMRAIEKVRMAKNSPIYWLDKDATCKVVSLGLEGSSFEYSGLGESQRFSIGLSGLHQIGNASLSVLAAEVGSKEGLRITKDSIKEGLSNARWPGRLDVISQEPVIVVDAAHNIAGVKTLVETISRIGFKPDVVLFGVLRDKEYEGMLRLLANTTKRFVFTKPNSPRALPLHRLAKAGDSLGLNYFLTSNIDKAIKKACSIATARGKILVCGSIYLIGDIMKTLGYDPCEKRIC